MGANVCPCLGRGKENGGEAGKELVADGSGGDHQHGWSVKKNQRERMEDAADATGNLFATVVQKQSALSRKSCPNSWAKSGALMGARD